MGQLPVLAFRPPAGQFRKHPPRRRPVTRTHVNESPGREIQRQICTEPAPLKPHFRVQRMHLPDLLPKSPRAVRLDSILEFGPPREHASGHNIEGIGSQQPAGDVGGLPALAVAPCDGQRALIGLEVQRPLRQEPPDQHRGIVQGTGFQNLVQSPHPPVQRNPRWLGPGLHRVGGKGHQRPPNH